jgi:capsular polysaccharide biosynthesis protein
MEIRLYIQMLRKGWWLIALAMLIAISASFFISYMVTPMYKAVASFIITPSANLGTGRDAVSGLNTLDNRSVIATYAEIMNSARIYKEALDSLKVSPGVLKEYSVSSVVLPDSSVLELTVTGPNPEATAHIANAIGLQSIIYTRSYNAVFDMNFLDKATPPSSPYSPQPLRDAGLAAVIGAVFGAILAILSEQIQTPLEAYRQRNRIDNQTGVNNARYFHTLVEQEVSEHPGDEMSIGIIHLHGLTDLVSNMPSSATQPLLRTVRDKLRQELRGNDVIGRWTDTSFIVMLPATSGPATKRIFDRIFQALVPPVTINQYALDISLDPRIGGSVYQAPLSPDEVLERAESAVEDARKDNSRPIYVWDLKNPFWVEENHEEDQQQPSP